MLKKIFRAINSYKEIKNMDIGWYEELAHNLSNSTLQRVNRYTISLDDLSDIIIDTMNERSAESEIDPLFNQKLDEFYHGKNGL